MTTFLHLVHGEEIECVKHKCKCRNCGLLIEVFVAASYMELGDYLKLLPLATCNRCGDYLSKTKAQARQIFKACKDLQDARRTVKPKELHEHEQKIYALLAKITKDYAMSVAAFYDCNYWWAEDMVQFFMEKPDHAGDILKKYMITYKRDVVNPTKAQQELPA